MQLKDLWISTKDNLYSSDELLSLGPLNTELDALTTEPRIHKNE